MILILNEKDFEEAIHVDRAPQCPVCGIPMLPDGAWKGEPMVLGFMCQNDHSDEEYDEVCHG